MADGAVSGTPSRRDSRFRRRVLSTTYARLGADPRLFVPFVLAGLLHSLLDWLRRRDPIPTLERGRPAGLDVTVEFAGYPTGVPQTGRPLESLVGLELPFLLWGLGTYGLALLAISAAGTLTIARALGVDATVDAHVRLFGFVLATNGAFRLLASIELLQGMGLYGLGPLAVLFFLYVRLFLVPALLVGGSSPRRALTESNRFVRGRGWAVFGLVLAIGLSAWLLAYVPAVGTLLSFSVVAPVHAVATAVVLERSPAAWSDAPARSVLA